MAFVKRTRGEIDICAENNEHRSLRIRCFFFFWLTIRHVIYVLLNCLSGRHCRLMQRCTWSVYRTYCNYIAYDRTPRETFVVVFDRSFLVSKNIKKKKTMTIFLPKIRVIVVDHYRPEECQLPHLTAVRSFELLRYRVRRVETHRNISLFRNRDDCYLKLKTFYSYYSKHA